MRAFELRQPPDTALQRTFPSVTPLAGARAAPVEATTELER